VRVSYLWEQYPSWIPTHELQKLRTNYGFTGGAGDVRARDLAEDKCPDKLKGKVERKDGCDIPGADSRYAYFRFVEKPSQAQYAAAAKRRGELFDAGAPTEQILAV
jgi:hypothetical protein